MIVEREKSLLELESRAKEAAEGRGSIVAIVGEAGIGKTTLLREFSKKTSANRKFFWGGCEALFTPRPLGPLQDIARSLDEKVATLLEQSATQDRLFPAVLNALQSRSGTTVMIFEDVHWADNATLDLIKYLGRRVSLLNTLLVLSFRSDEVGADHPLAQVMGDLPSFALRRIALQPLTEKGVASIAKHFDKAHDSIHRITAGNPFFVTELLARSDDHQSGIPSSVRDAVWSRLSRLSQAERNVLEAMSIIPGGASILLVKTIFSEGTERIVSQCVDRGVLVREANGHLRFRHELARLATLERLSASDQKSLHERALAAMALIDPDETLFPLSARVHHASRAEDDQRVLELAPRAAAEAAKLGAHQQAAAHLKTALCYAENAETVLAAQLYEDWAYEAALALAIDEETIAARQKAVQLWRSLGNIEKVALNLRWLSRMHWYRGEAALAEKYIEEAKLQVEGLSPGRERAMVYSAISQFMMLRDRADEAIEWGKRAISLAEEFDVMETRIHALNNVGSALLNSGRETGRPLMEESLALALKHGFHEQAARAYTNYGEYAVISRDFPLAERLISEGIAFDTSHDLDSWTYYLVGRQAQLRMDQGRLREAQTIAQGVMGLDGQTLLMQLPARTVLGKVNTRLGIAGSLDILEKALADAIATAEPQYITPARLGLVEEAWLRKDLDACHHQLTALAEMDGTRFDPWERGEVAVWRLRCGLPNAPDAGSSVIASPYKAMLNDNETAAAAEWLELGLPYEAALAVLQAGSNADTAQLVQAMRSLENMGATPALELARDLARQLGLPTELIKYRRGPYSAARNHPLGLTGKEVQVLELMAKGLGNPAIAKKLVRSQRTVEHHVSSVLEKMNANNRMDVVLRLQSEPWLLPSHTSQIEI